MNLELDGAVAIVTGSSAGIGLGIATALAENGARVVITSRDEVRAQEVAEKVTLATGSETLGVSFDLARRSDGGKLLNTVVEHFGQLDVLVNNAADFTMASSLTDVTEEQLDVAITSNVTNTLNIARLAYPHLVATKGSMLNVSSVVTNRHLMGLSIYTIVKGAISQLTKALAAEWAVDGVRVNGINPGFVRTEAFSSMGMPQEMVDESYEYYKRYHPLGKIGEPKDVGTLAAFLVSKHSALMTGGIVEVDGGYSVQGLPLYNPA